MGNNKTKTDGKDRAVVVDVEFQVSMHCNACERTVAKAISGIKGVEEYMTDTTRHRVRVTGEIDPEKVLKKLRKKTGKRVEIVKSADEDKEATTKAESDSALLLRGGDRQSGLVVAGDEDSVLLFDGWTWTEYGILTLFSDENPNACSVM